MVFAVAAANIDADMFDAILEPLSSNYAEKDLLVPRCVVFVERGRSYLCSLNCSSQSVVLPEGINLSEYESNQCVSVAVMGDQGAPGDIITPSSNLLSIVKKSHSSPECDTLVDILSRHVYVFDFSQDGSPSALPASRARRTIDTRLAHQIRQKHYGWHRSASLSLTR